MGNLSINDLNSCTVCKSDVAEKVVLDTFHKSTFLNTNILAFTKTHFSLLR